MELQKLYDLRGRVLRGEPVSDEELAEAIKQLRVGREAAGAAKESKAKAPKVSFSLADLVKRPQVATPVPASLPSPEATQG
jgi:hypothetical protein